MGKRKEPFSIFFNEKLKALNERTQNNLSTEDIGNAIGITYEMFRKIVNRKKPNQTRDCIIAISAVLELNSDEANEAISIYDGNMPHLEAAIDNTVTRDDLIIEILENQIIYQLSIHEIDQLLLASGFPALHIIDHRKKSSEEDDDFECIDNGDNVEYNRDDYIYGDKYDSLETEYIYKTNRITAQMELLCKADGTKYYLRCNYEISYDIKNSNKLKGEFNYQYVRENSEPVAVMNINESGHLKPFFLKLKYQIKCEKSRILDVLNDTRNYYERVSAKVISNELHVFYETYNYTVPELGEYYLMDYVNGKYTLYVSHESRFMRFYLSEKEYHDLFGKSSDKYEECYSSEVEIISEAAPRRPYRGEMIRLRSRAFRDAQDKINALIDKLRSGQVHIRNFVMIYDFDYEVLSYYKVEEAFQCTYHPEYDVIDGIGIDKITVTLPEGIQADLSFEDLCEGFKLGLSTIEEVGTFLITHKTFDLEELLKIGTC